MLLKEPVLRRIEDRSVTLVFRRWRRPTVKGGGTLLTAIGQLAIEAVDPVDPDAITGEEAAAAGYEDLESLRAELERRPEGTVYRIRVSLAGPDPRIALRERVPEGDELGAVVDRVLAMDPDADDPDAGDRDPGVRASEPWPLVFLRAIRDRPATRAAELADGVGWARDDFKRRVRRLKELGLTESLEVGYRLSPRGEAVLRELARTASPKTRVE